MEMTRRQFTLSLAAASYLGRTLFEPLTPLGVPRGVVPGRVTWAHDPAAVRWDQSFLKQYRGLSYRDSRYQGGSQKIPGRVFCAYYDLGGEGVAYHDTD